MAMKLNPGANCKGITVDIAVLHTVFDCDL
jgi:hypothetical protein